MCGGVRRTRCRALLLRHYQKLASHSGEKHLFWISIAHARRAVTISRRSIVCTASANLAACSTTDHTAQSLRLCPATLPAFETARSSFPSSTPAASRAGLRSYVFRAIASTSVMTDHFPSSGQAHFAGIITPWDKRSPPCDCSTECIWLSALSKKRESPNSCVR
jgi:hypothetical protein